MKIKEVKALQDQRLKEICHEKDIEYDTLEVLLDSVRTKKLLKRNNYHQQKIIDIIEGAIL